MEVLLSIIKNNINLMASTKGQLKKSSTTNKLCHDRDIFRSLSKIEDEPFPAGNCMFKVKNIKNNKNIRTRCEICSKLKIRTLE